MNNTNETVGLRVLTVSPNHRASDVNVNSSIDITFSSDINPASFMKNIVVLEDYNRIFKNINSLKDYSQYSVVKGSISYKDKVLTYTPNEPFHTDTCYVVMLSDGITDITGNKLIKKHVSCFYTEAVASYPPCEILSPKYGCIVSAIPEFSWKNQGAESYVFQVSKNNTFELLLCNEMIPGNQVEDILRYTPVFKAEEGIYHVRVKSEGGDWSNVHQIFIKEITDAVIAEQDTPEILHLDEFLDGLEEPIEILEYFPAPDSINNSLKTNLIYIKMKGKVDEDKLKLDDCYVYGESFDEEREEYAHETIDGKWSVVYDSYFDVTYVIFTPVNLDDVEELEFLETLRSGNLIEATTQTGGANSENQ